MKSSKVVYIVSATVWVTIALITLALCISSKWFIRVVLPICIAGILVICATPFLQRLTKRPDFWLYGISLGLHIVAFIAITLINKNMYYRSFVVKFSLLLAVCSLAETLIQTFLIFNFQRLKILVAQSQNIFKKIMIIAIILSIIVVIVKVVLFPTTWKYCDLLIIGKTYDEIIVKYGEFDIEFYQYDSNNIRSAGYYLREENSMFDEHGGTKKYYIITFDENKKAQSVKIDGGWGG